MAFFASLLKDILIAYLITVQPESIDSRIIFIAKVSKVCWYGY